MKRPLVSIVTPTLNRGSFLEKAIQSIANQDYDDIEHIVIDGVSSDNTIEILKKYEGKYNLRWISEKDKNQTEAWNKGLKMAKGEIVGWCCSDDYYVPGAISKIAKAFMENPKIDLVFGACQEYDYETKKFTKIFRNDPLKIANITPEDILYGRQTLRQPALFFGRRIIEKTGLLTPDIKFMMDYDWEIRMLKKGAKVLYLDEILAIIGNHPGRGSVKAAAKGVRASMDLIKSYGGRVPIYLKISYLRWKYPQVPNFLKKYTPPIFLVIKKIIKKI